jgi:NDP-sugar pyrophosphorylase family protein
MQIYSMENLFPAQKSMGWPILGNYRYPWEVLPHIGAGILQLGALLPEDMYDHPSETVWIAKSAKIAPSASITGPCIIGPGTEVRHCAFIRGNALVGEGCVVGNSTD